MSIHSIKYIIKKQYYGNTSFFYRNRERKSFVSRQIVRHNINTFKVVIINVLCCCSDE